MSSTVYLASAALEQLAAAQSEIDRHVAAGPGGRCLGCGEEQPCRAFRRACETFARYRRLPLRRPGWARRALTR